MMHTAIGERMKKYERVTKIFVTDNSFVGIRVDGRAFHTFTRGMDKPFDVKLIESMLVAGILTAKEINCFKLGYHQSDEFTFIMGNSQSPESQLWFDGEVQKLCSITASLFTAKFNKAMGGTEAVFDCRVFNIPYDDVANLLVWRQLDWERNSLMMFARSLFSQKELHKKKRTEVHEMLHSKGVNWVDLHDMLKNGTFITKDGERIHKKLNYSELNELLGITV